MPAEQRSAATRRGPASRRTRRIRRRYSGFSAPRRPPERVDAGRDAAGLVLRIGIGQTWQPSRRATSRTDETLPRGPERAQHERHLRRRHCSEPIVQRPPRSVSDRATRKPARFVPDDSIGVRESMSACVLAPTAISSRHDGTRSRTSAQPAPGSSRLFQMRPLQPSSQALRTSRVRRRMPVRAYDPIASDHGAIPRGTEIGLLRSSGSPARRAAVVAPERAAPQRSGSTRSASRR